MVEVFKTNVEDTVEARLLIDQIHQQFDNWRANFDLDDCDRILRVACESYTIDAESVIKLLRKSGYQASILDG